MTVKRGSSIIYSQRLVKTTESSGETPKSSTEVFIKGSDDSSSYSLKSEKDQTYVVTLSSGKKLELNRHNLREVLKDLHRQAHVSVKVLNEAHTASFRNLLEIFKKLHGTKALKEIVLEDVKQIYGDIKNPHPGTVGAYFIGCSCDKSFPGPNGCNPRCTSSLPNGEHEFSECEDGVLIFTNGNFSTLNEKYTDHVYIYVGSEDFKGFNEENVKQLKEANIRSVTLIYGKPDGSYGDIEKSVSVDKLVSSERIPEDLSDSENADNSSSWATAIAFILLFILIILLLVLLIKNNHFKDMVSW